MRFLSLFSGIEGATEAWAPLGWTCAGVAEVEPFPCRVLHERHGAGRPRYMPPADEPDLLAKVVRERAARIKAVACLPLEAQLVNLGDVTQVTEADVAALGQIDVVVGGSPCQDLSVAGKRAGLVGARSSLFHHQVRIFHAARSLCGARFLVWENVPGAFSSHGGRDFAAVVGALAGCRFGVPAQGWGQAGAAAGPAGLVEWRVLDAQFFGLAQRRKRVFAVLDTGDWQGRAPVLLEPEGLRGDPQPRREAREDLAGTLAARAGGGGRPDGGDGRHAQLIGTLQANTGRCQVDSPMIPEVAPTLRAGGNSTGGDRPPGTDVDTVETLIPVAFADVADPVAANQGRTYTREGSENFRLSNVALAMPFDTTQITSKTNRSNPRPGDPCHPLAAAAHPPAIAFTAKDHGADAAEDLAPTLRSGGHDGSHANGGVMPAIAFEPRVASGRRAGVIGDTVGPLTKESDRGDGHPCVAVAATLGQRMRGQDDGCADNLQPAAGGAVRRLTPLECERLQGFRDGYTRIPWQRCKARRITNMRPADRWEQNEDGSWTLFAADGPRYKALGNSFAVPPVRWIGRRIQVAAGG